MCFKHNWEVVENYKFNEELSKFSGVSMSGFIADSLSKRGVITVMQCGKCSKIKHIKSKM